MRSQTLNEFSLALAVLCSLTSLCGAAGETNSPPAPKGDVRTWTSVNDQKIEAVFTSLIEDRVYLTRPDGQVICIEQEKLSDADQSLAVELAAKQGQKDAAGKTGIRKPLVSAPKKVQKDLGEMFGNMLVNADGKKFTMSAIAGRPVGVYFTGAWSKAGRRFTPKLLAFYYELQKQKKPFEVVLVSSDEDEASMYKHMKETRMPWLAMPYGAKDVEGLTIRFNGGLRSVPKLVILDKKGKLVTEEGLDGVLTEGTKAYDGW